MLTFTRAGDQSRKTNICVNRLSISLYLLSCLSPFIECSLSTYRRYNRDDTSAEDARVQENPAGDDLSHIVDYSSQFCHLDCHIADLLLRVRGSSLGHRSTGSAMYGVRC